MPKPKNKVRTREELLKDLKGNKEFQKKMAFTRDVFFPALDKATTSIEDAQQNLHMINSVVMEGFLGFMKEKKMKDLNIVSKLSITDPNYSNMKAMIELFDDFNIFDAKDHFEGMKNEINLFLSEENKKRKLSDLKDVVWIDQLK